MGDSSEFMYCNNNNNKRLRIDSHINDIHEPIIQLERENSIKLMKLATNIEDLLSLVRILRISNDYIYSAAEQAIREKFSNYSFFVLLIESFPFLSNQYFGYIKFLSRESNLINYLPIKSMFGMNPNYFDNIEIWSYWIKSCSLSCLQYMFHMAEAIGRKQLLLLVEDTELVTQLGYDTIKKIVWLKSVNIQVKIK